ncbi:hypothetical protein LQ318_05205 [Aliifodinibius salicampi]|uniref:Membrane-anchored ribosome-binding protein, inhibits growth in stationary phase, ElaB/YqjD/DUF883 family n=1 Tax=Fodinibius salicampi TaxID=1920655 RepID=A0ABT3PWR9_9BACT|nr:hypothetical protein [Fodinibius salicampi]MCW9712300.1 hypothetical protein [Fodinibius salicampi]
MAQDKEHNESNGEETTEEQKKQHIRSYEKLIDQLKQERDSVREAVDHDYREARRYVRSHPEEGVLFAFAGGLALGFILGKLSNR